MAKKVIVETCEFFYHNGITSTINRYFIVPRSYKKLSARTFSYRLRRKTHVNGTYLIAYKYGNADVKAPLFLKEFKEVKIECMKETSDWYIEQIFDKTDRKTLDRRVDPAILVISDAKRLEYRIKYYLDLINQGYSQEEAMKNIF